MSQRYIVRFSKKADKEFTKLAKRDPFSADLIAHWFEENIEGCEDPRVFGSGLRGNRSGEWRYRIGSYRVLAEIFDSEVVVEIIKLGHRSKVYK